MHATILKYGKIKIVKKRSPRWTNTEVEALITAIELNRKHLLGSLSAEVTMASMQQAWKIVTTKANMMLTCGIFGGLCVDHNGNFCCR